MKQMDTIQQELLTDIDPSNAYHEINNILKYHLYNAAFKILWIEHIEQEVDSDFSHDYTAEQNNRVINLLNPNSIPDKIKGARIQSNLKYRRYRVKDFNNGVSDTNQCPDILVVNPYTYQVIFNDHDPIHETEKQSNYRTTLECALYVATIPKIQELLITTDQQIGFQLLDNHSLNTESKMILNWVIYDHLSRTRSRKRFSFEGNSTTKDILDYLENLINIYQDNPNFITVNMDKIFAKKNFIENPDPSFILTNSYLFNRYIQFKDENPTEYLVHDGMSYKSRVKFYVDCREFGITIPKIPDTYTDNPLPPIY